MAETLADLPKDATPLTGYTNASPSSVRCFCSEFFGQISDGFQGTWWVFRSVAGKIRSPKSLIREALRQHGTQRLPS